jgi:hypothetical protein
VDTNPRHMQQFFRAVSTTKSNPYFAWHNVHRFISSFIRPVGLVTSLTVGLKGILAPFPKGMKSFSLLHRFQSDTGVHKLCYPKGARTLYKGTSMIDHEAD